jgi:hypothetical protein
LRQSSNSGVVDVAIIASFLEVMVFISLRALVSKNKLSNLSRQSFCNNPNEQRSMQYYHAFGSILGVFRFGCSILLGQSQTISRLLQVKNK